MLKLCVNLLTVLNSPVWLRGVCFDNLVASFSDILLYFFCTLVFLCVYSSCFVSLKKIHLMFSLNY